MANNTVNMMEVSNFEFKFDRISSASFFGKTAEIPGISLTSVPMPTPLVKVPVPGDHVQFEPFNLTFYVDENLLNYRQIFNWMMQNGTPEDQRQYGERRLTNVIGPRDQVHMGDGSLFLFNSNRIAHIEVKFRDMLPSVLSPIQFDTSQSEITYPECTVSLDYTSFTFVDKI